MARQLTTALAVVLLIAIFVRRRWLEGAAPRSDTAPAPGVDAPASPGHAPLPAQAAQAALPTRSTRVAVAASGLGVVVAALVVGGVFAGWIPGSSTGDADASVSTVERTRPQAIPFEPLRAIADAVSASSADASLVDASLVDASLVEASASRRPDEALSPLADAGPVSSAVPRRTPAEVVLPAAQPSGGAVFSSLDHVALQERAQSTSDGLRFLPPSAATSVGSYIPWPVHSPLALSDGATQVDRLAGTLLPLRFQLQPLIEAFSANSSTAEEGARAGIAVMDLQTGERVAVNGDTQLQAASTIKFYVVLSVLRDIQLGYYTFDDVASDIWGVMVPQSNASARELTLRTGLRTVNLRLDDWGIDNTVITHPSGYTWEPDPLYGHNDNLTTAADAVRGLSLLYQARLAGAEHSRNLLEQFTTLPRHFGIEGAVPDHQGRVFYKVGWLPAEDHSSINDLAIVEFERNGETRAFAIAIYTQGAVPQYPAWALVREAAGLVWEHFVSVRYPETPLATPGPAGETLAVAP